MSKSRIHRCNEDHVLFTSLWEKGVPAAEIAYILDLSKPQMANHLTKAVEADLDRTRPSYEVVSPKELPRNLKKMLFSDAPLYKVESAGDGLVLTPYAPEKVKKVTDDQMAEEASEICDDLAGADPTAEVQA